MKIISFHSVAIIAGALFIAVLLHAQVENQSRGIPADVPYFNFDAISFMETDSSAARVDVYAQVPYENLRFVSSGSSFIATYEIAVDVVDNDDATVFEKSWDEEVKVGSFGETQSKEAYSLTRRSFPLMAGTYNMRVRVQDEETRKEFTRRENIAVPDYTHETLGISGIMLLNRLTQNGTSNSIVPNISGNLDEMQNGFGIFFELYNRTPADSVDVVYHVLDSKEHDLYSEQQTFRLDSGRTQVITHIDSASFPVGQYTLVVAARAVVDARNSKSVAAESRRSFFARWRDFPLTLNDINLAIRQLRYIAKDDEYDSLTSAKTLETKQALFRRFWERRNPSPGSRNNLYMQQYYQRVQYANDHFSHYLAGWRTDMGMVYIMLGPPDNVDRHPFDFDAKPYELWSYYDLNRTLLFVDDTGFGDYRLYTPIWDILQRIK
ncbi:MAG: GWxTD domain-containing protein [Bacteroidota bacterium]|nr:GWxTD domain-containing protein [Bacteroidota bacterium]